MDDNTDDIVEELEKYGKAALFLNKINIDKIFKDPKLRKKLKELNLQGTLEIVLRQFPTNLKTKEIKKWLEKNRKKVSKMTIHEIRKELNLPTSQREWLRIFLKQKGFEYKETENAKFGKNKEKIEKWAKKFRKGKTKSSNDKKIKTELSPSAIFKSIIGRYSSGPEIKMVIEVLKKYNIVSKENYQPPWKK